MAMAGGEKERQTDRQTNRDGEYSCTKEGFHTPLGCIRKKERKGRLGHREGKNEMVCKCLFIIF